MTDKIQSIVILVVAILVTVFVTRWMTPPDIIYQTEHQQEQIDSLTVELQSSITERSALLDSIGNVTEGFRERLTAKDEQIASLTQVTGELNLTVDSLQSRRSVHLTDIGLTAGSPVIRDTTLTVTSYFGDRLLSVQSQAGIQDGALFLDPPEINKLRPVRLHIATMLRDSDNRVTTIVTSPDFTDLNLKSQTEIKPPGRKFPWFWVGLGAGLSASLLL